MKTTTNSNPSKYSNHDMLNLISIVIVALLCVIFLGGMLFRIPWFATIFRKYLIPVATFCLGFFISGILLKAHYIELLNRKNAELKNIEQTRSKLANANKAARDHMQWKAREAIKANLK